MNLPQKLRNDLLKSSSEQRNAFGQFVKELIEERKHLSVESRARYSAIYDGRNPIVYIDPQAHGIDFGFFGDYTLKEIRRRNLYVYEGKTWNPTKGGLKWFRADGSGEELRERFEQVHDLSDISAQRNRCFIREIHGP